MARKIAFYMAVKTLQLGVAGLLALFLVPLLAGAEVLESDNFKVLDPVISIGGGTQSTSTNFSLIQTFGESAAGTSTVTSFQILSGFLEYPTITKPSSVAASAGDGEVDLSWSASVATGGWSVGGYTIGQSTASGGPYAYSSAGDVTSTTASGLSNGTAYFFVVVTEDAFGNHIATSTEVSAIPQAAAEEEEEEAVSSGGGGPAGLIDAIRNIFELEPEEPEEEIPEESIRFDVNRDGRITIADISVLFYCWDGRNALPLTDRQNAGCEERVDFNSDGHVNLADLSILLYYVGGVLSR